MRVWQSLVEGGEEKAVHQSRWWQSGENPRTGQRRLVFWAGRPEGREARASWGGWPARKYLGNISNLDVIRMRLFGHTCNPVGEAGQTVEPMSTGVIFDELP